MEMDNVTTNIRKFYVEAYLGISPKANPKYWLVFQVSVPPLGWNTYLVSEVAGAGCFNYSKYSLFFILWN